jgi:hypothetical protein
LERDAAARSRGALTTSDIEALRRLMIEVRELTLSRATYSAATDFLKRFGGEADDLELVRPEAIVD